MSILQALDGYYDRMAARKEVPDYGFTVENIDYAVSLDNDGSVLTVADLRTENKKGKPTPRRLVVPRPKRTSDVTANFLWDKTAYAFGVDSGKSKRLAKEHAEFVRFHREVLSQISDAHVFAFLAFLERWKPENFQSAPFTKEMLGSSFVFRLGGEHQFLHELPILREVWVASLNEPDAPKGICLISGEYSEIETGHPIVKNVDDAQTSGAYLVSFNDTAFTSYGKPINATNAPTSKKSAFRYGAALNRLLDRSSRNRIKIGDATVVFWADTMETVKEKEAAAAEDFMASFLVAPSRESVDADEQEAAKLNDVLQILRKGRPVEDLNLGLKTGTRFHILGLSPNAARLSVRFWLSDDFSVFAKCLADHADDVRIDPAPWKKPPSISQLLVKTTALLEKFENIPPLLAGEVTRAVLTGARYPQSLLAAAIMRLRAGDDASTGWHAAIIKAVISRNLRLKWTKEKSMSEDTTPLDPTVEEKKKSLLPPIGLDVSCRSTAYQLGRLFALLEAAQYAALGRVNAPISDRYYGAASATPSRVFGPLLRGLRHHLSDARKRGQGGWLEPRIAEVMAMLPADLPRTLNLEDQGRFAVGYYHQAALRYSKDSKIDQTGEEKNGK